MFLHGFKVAEFFFNPLKYKACDIDRIARRSVEHRAVFGVDLVVKHGGGNITRVANKVFADNDDGNTRGGEVLLSARVKYAEFRYVDGFREDAA